MAGLWRTIETLYKVLLDIEGHTSINNVQHLSMRHFDDMSITAIFERTNCYSLSTGYDRPKEHCLALLSSYWSDFLLGAKLFICQTSEEHLQNAGIYLVFTVGDANEFRGNFGVIHQTCFFGIRYM